MRRRALCHLGPLLLAVALGAACSPSNASEADEATRLVQLLGLAPGSIVADVGAGDGEWLEPLATAVGPTGRVYATEVDEDLVDDIRSTVETNGLDRVEVVLGDQASTGLPARCCDAILLRMVYHHFEDPATMRADLAKALVPGGRVVIVETDIQHGWSDVDDVPDRGGHGIPLDVLIDEMTSDGFAEVERRLEWNDDEKRYAIVFASVRRP